MDNCPNIIAKQDSVTYAHVRAHSPDSHEEIGEEKVYAKFMTQHHLQLRCESTFRWHCVKGSTVRQGLLIRRKTKDFFPLKNKRSSEDLERHCQLSRL